MDYFLNFALSIIGVIISGAIVAYLKPLMKWKGQQHLEINFAQDTFLKETYSQLEKAMIGDFYRVLGNLNKIENKLSPYFNEEEKDELNNIYKLKEKEIEIYSQDIKEYNIGFTGGENKMSKTYQAFLFKVLKRLEKNKKLLKVKDDFREKT